MHDPAPEVVPKLTVTEHLATSLSLMAYARVAMVVVGVMSPPVAGFGIWATNRLVTTMDKIAEKQEKTGQEYVELKAQVIHIVSDQVTNTKNIADRIEQGEHVLNDRLNQQSGWMQQLSAKFEDLSKYVYQKVR